MTQSDGSYCPACGATPREGCKRPVGLHCRREQLAPVNPEPVRHTALGKDATCSYCGGALWVCRGVHNIC